MKSTEDDTLKFTYGGHGEEWFASVFGGVGYTRTNNLSVNVASIGYGYNF